MDRSATCCAPRPRASARRRRVRRPAAQGSHFYAHLSRFRATDTANHDARAVRPGAKVAASRALARHPVQWPGATTPGSMRSPGRGRSARYALHRFSGQVIATQHDIDRHAGKALLGFETRIHDAGMGARRKYADAAPLDARGDDRLSMISGSAAPSAPWKLWWPTRPVSYSVTRSTARCRRRSPRRAGEARPG